MWNNSSMTSGAGGFLDSSYNATDTQQDNKGDKANRGANIIPLMIGHLQKCKANSKTITGNPVRMVTVVAILRTVTRVTTKVTYELEDETGTISAHKWLEADATVSDQMEVNNYVRVYGTLREQGKDVYLFVLNIRPVKKYAEVFSHLMEVVYSAMKMKNVGVVKPVEDENITGALDDACHGLTNAQKTIYKIVKASVANDGIEKSEIKGKVPSSLVANIDEILEFLCNEGHIYTACTDNHFKAT